GLAARADPHEPEALDQEILEPGLRVADRIGPRLVRELDRVAGLGAVGEDPADAAEQGGDAARLVLVADAVAVDVDHLDGVVAEGWPRAALGGRVVDDRPVVGGAEVADAAAGVLGRPVARRAVADAAPRVAHEAALEARAVGRRAAALGDAHELLGAVGGE